MFRNQYIEKNGSTRPVKKTGGHDSEMLTRLEAIDRMLHGVGDTVWNKLYSRKLFNTVSYPEGYFYEDVGTTYKTVLLADSIYYLDRILYSHCYRDGSITTLKTKKALQDRLKMLMQKYHDLVIWGYPADKLESLLNSIALTYCMYNKSDVNDVNYVFSQKTLVSSKKIPEDFTWRRKVLFVLLKYCPPLFDLLCNLWGKRW